MRAPFRTPRMSAPFDATPILRAVAARRHARLLAMDPAATQQTLLMGLLKRAAATRFGRDHGFDALRSVADFQRAVPLRRYEELHDAYLAPALPVLDDVLWPGRTPYLALSSGTTSGRTKHVPVTRAMVRANRGAAFDVLAWHLALHPRARPFGGLSFILGGSTDLTQVAPGVRAGDLSGIAAVEVPWFLRAWAWPPERIALMPHWDAKLDALAAEAPARDIRTLSGTPSWLLVLLERLAARHGMPPLPWPGRRIATGLRPSCRELARRGKSIRPARASSPSPIAARARGCDCAWTAAASLNSCPWANWTRQTRRATGPPPSRPGWTTPWSCHPAPGCAAMCWATRCDSWTARRRGCW
jgi:hypothetical protein